MLSQGNVYHNKGCHLPSFDPTNSPIKGELKVSAPHPLSPSYFCQPVSLVAAAPADASDVFFLAGAVFFVSPFPLSQKSSQSSNGGNLYRGSFYRPQIQGSSSARGLVVCGVFVGWEFGKTGVILVGCETFLRVVANMRGERG